MDKRDGLDGGRLNSSSLGGRYLTFVLAGEDYGIEILKVREIIGMLEVTAVPRTPCHVKGVVNLRGSVIPVIDLRLKFGMKEAEYTEETCIIVADVDGVEMGVIVDCVSEVLNIAEKDIEEPPSFGTGVDTEFIVGMGKTGGQVTILLDITRVLATAELAVVMNVAEAEGAPVQNVN